MNTAEGKAWRILAQTKGVGDRALWRLADFLSARGQTAAWLLRHPAEIGAALRLKPGAVVPPAQPGAETPAAPGGRTVTLLHPLHPRFPERLRARRDRSPLPALLYVFGDLSLLARPAVAVVGSRDAGREELVVAGNLASALAAAGMAVVSGYAPGIDEAAHLAALEAGGSTLLVLAEGLGCFRERPRFRGRLSAENALLVSPFEPHKRWAGFQAMARNKLVCALSDAVVVVASGPERDPAGRMSGSFDAGLAAVKMGIPAFTVDPAHYASPPPGNRELIARGLGAWDPAAGVAPLLDRLRAPISKNPGEQLPLFGK